MKKYKIKIGDVWRKHGPADWVKVVGWQLPDMPNYDGALPGVSIRLRTFKGKWMKQNWFHPAKSCDDFAESMSNHSRYMEASQ